MTAEALHEIAHSDCVHVTAAIYVLFTIYENFPNARERFSYRRCEFRVDRSHVAIIIYRNQLRH